MKQPENNRVKSEEHAPLTTPIAIIGVASIFPEAHNVQEYWNNIIRKIDCIIDVPASRWDVADYYDPNPTAPDKTYCKRGGFLPDIDFDPLEFGLPPNILEVTDVSQLLSLVVAKDAFEDAGYGEGREFNRDATGVILGVVGVGTKLYQPLMARLQYPVWEKVLKSYGVPEADVKKIVEKIKTAYVGWEENSFPGTIGNVVAGRIANRFDLGSVNCVVDAACGSSLAAVKMAIGELIQGRADMMVTGGVDTDNSIGAYLCFSKTPAFSKSSSIKPFDVEADGMMVGEGIGMVVLKRLADAERDHDRIYAVIRGVGSSSDGRFKSIYAPRPAGQAKALRRAYLEAGYSPATVSLVEAHGTGTGAGDPAEVESMREVFGENNPQKESIALGSVKSQIAHTKAAAGAASLIKIALSLHHKILPATINVNKPNPKLELDKSPFYVNTEVRPWIRPEGGLPRRAGVSSFGFGGTNFHLALEEYEADHDGPYRLHATAQPIILTAPTHADLVAACSSAVDKLKSDQTSKTYVDLVATQSADVPADAPRVGFTAASPVEAREMLEQATQLLKDKPAADSWDHPKGIYYRKAGLNPTGKVVGLFSGQGSQYIDMGRELAVNFPTVREAYAGMDGLFAQDGLEPLSKTVFPAPQFDPAEKDARQKKLQRTEFAQPAIGVTSVALYKLLQAAGFKADFVAGHSFGELTALWAGGVLDDKSYFTLAKARGKAMAAPDDPNFDAGTMVAVKGDTDKIQAEIKDYPEITLANFNSKNQAVLAGSKPAIAKIKQVLADKGYSVVQLPVSAAFHTPLVGHAQEPFARAIQSVDFHKPVTPVFSNTTATEYPKEPKAIREILSGHILKPVLFKDEIEAIYAQGGYFFIEFGPKNILTNLVKNILDGKPHFAIALNSNANQDSDRQFRDAYVQLKVAGIQLKSMDPFAVMKVAAPKKKSPVTVVLNGGHYVSPKTQAAFVNALKDAREHPMVLHAAPSPAPAAVSSNGGSTSTAKAPETAPAPAPAAAQVQAAPLAAADLMPMLGHLEHNLDQIQAHQSETLRAHEQYLTNQVEYSKTFSQLMQLGYSALNGVNTSEGLEKAAAVLESLERSLARFHDHQQETLRVHERYLGGQLDFSQSLFQLVQQQQSLLAGGTVFTAPAAAPAAAQTVQPARTAPAAPPPPPAPTRPVPQAVASNGNGSTKTQSLPEKPAPAPATVASAAKPAGAVDLEAVSKGLFQVVSEKTGYPVEMLEANMDMEADLGIDSIKRVEILGGLQGLFPELPKPDPEALAELRTLAQIVEYMGAKAPAQAGAQASTTQAAPTPAGVTAAAPTSTGVTAESLTKALLAIVSEKTGYPAEMLELGMDMEADLGIDSIKRVEILGAMQSQFPELPPVDPNALSEMRTLGQIADAMQSKVAGSTAAPAAETKAEAPVETPPQSAPEVSGAVGDALQKALLTVVSEKTGYPAEMLEMTMDMEADLGIDSIKRVEILGAMQAQFPDLPKADPEALAETRTLGQIIELMGAVPTNGSAAAEKEGKPSASPFDSALPRGLVRLKALPRPDDFALTIPEGTICLVTDDGTQATADLVAGLQTRGWRVVVLSFPTSVVASQASLPGGVPRFALVDLAEQHLQETLAAIASQHGPVGAFIHLDPVEAGKPSDGGLFFETSKAVVKHVFLMAKYLKEPLNQAARQGRSAFMSVVRMDGEFGLGQNTHFDPVCGGLFGLVKTLNLEWNPVFCRAIDLGSAMDPQLAAQAVLSELYDPNQLITEVAYGNQGRCTLEVETPEIGGGNHG